MYDKHTTDSIKNYDKLAKNYDNTFDGSFTRDLKKRLVDYVNVRRNSRILDVACANGSLLHMINSKIPIEGYGIDISSEMIKEAKSAHSEFNFSISSSSKLCFGDYYFDAVTVCAAFHHFSEPINFLNEAKRVLKPGGLLFLMEPYFSPVIRFLSNLLIPFMKMGDVRIYKRKELEKMLYECGFIVTHYSRETDHGCLLISKSA